VSTAPGKARTLRNIQQHSKRGGATTKCRSTFLLNIWSQRVVVPCGGGGRPVAAQVAAALLGEALVLDRISRRCQGGTGGLQGAGCAPERRTSGQRAAVAENGFELVPNEQNSQNKVLCVVLALLSIKPSPFKSKSSNLNPAVPTSMLHFSAKVRTTSLKKGKLDYKISITITITSVLY
jgi:hypothetical protein